MELTLEYFSLSFEGRRGMKGRHRGYKYFPSIALFSPPPPLLLLLRFPLSEGIPLKREWPPFRSDSKSI